MSSIKVQRMDPSMALVGDILSVLSSRLPANTSSGDDLPKYNYPSAGHLYPVQTLVFLPVSGFLGYHHPLNNCLVALPPPKHLVEVLEGFKAQANTNNNNNNNNETNKQTTNTTLKDSTEDELTKNNKKPPTSPPVYLIFIAEREAIEPVYGGDLSMEFCYLEAGYMEELINLSLEDILSHHNTTATLSNIPIQSDDDKLAAELGLTSSQIPIHMLLLQQ